MLISVSSQKFLQPTAYSLQLTASLFLCGPTGVGKSALALLLAKQLGAEIVGADAFQIYRWLPILTAQPSRQEQEAIPHHLVGIIPPTESFDAVRYRELALAAIENIVSRNKKPLIVGGTGLYVRALLAPLDPLPPVDETLRSELKELSLEALLLRLQTLDPTAALLIDIKNRRRVERAIEIVTATKLPLATSWRRHQQSSESEKDSQPKGLLLIRDRPELFERIEQNVEQMFERGVVEEVATLSKLSLSATASMTLGLREIQQHLLGKQSLQATKAAIITATKRYAKRQLTWFRHQHSFPTLNLSLLPSLEAAAEEAAVLVKGEE